MNDNEQTNISAWGDYEIKKALWITGIIVAVELALIMWIYPWVDPGDEEVLVRYFIQRSVPVLGCMTAMVWTGLLVNFVTPVDWFKVMGRSSIACALVLVFLMYAVLQLWLYG